MRTLAIDTSLAAGSVAAVDGGSIAVRSLDAAAAHARRLARSVVDVTTELGFRPRDVGLVAVVRGPGSFTGLRIGVTTAKGIAWAASARLVGVSGFEVVARQTARLTGCTDRPVAIAYDAGRGDVYAALVRADRDSSSGWRVGPAALRAAGDWLAEIPPGAWLAGPALDVPGLLDAAAPPAGVERAPREAWRPQAAEVAAVAVLHAHAGAADAAAFALVPEYMRPSYADERATAPVPQVDGR